MSGSSLKADGLTGSDGFNSPATAVVRVDAVTPKQPPPEARESIRVRQLVILSFWAVVVFLGLPLWWWTTSVFRARLPLQKMENWAEGKVSFLACPGGYC